MTAICVRNKNDWSWTMVRYCPNWISWWWIFWYKYIRLFNEVEARRVSK